jgi:methionine--tRNA ligase beta chain
VSMPYNHAMISYDDFKKVEIRAGKILSAEKIPETDKLLKLSVDFAEKKDGIDAPRQIVSGISMYFPDPAILVGKTCLFVTNLEPRQIKGFESNGMLFAISTPEGGFSLLEPNGSIPPGTQAA